jgi:hypothetical protein
VASYRYGVARPLCFNPRRARPPAREVLIRRREVAADLFAIEAAHVSCDARWRC